VLKNLKDTLTRLYAQADALKEQIAQVEAQISRATLKEEHWSDVLLQVASYEVTSQVKRPKAFGQKRKTNATENWLFGGKSVNYEKLKDFCLRHGARDPSIAATAQDHEDYYHDFVVFLCEKDNLASMMVKGKDPSFNSVFHHFKQFIWRASMVEGQDALQRQRGRKTQQECKRGSRYAYISENSAKQVIRTNEDNPEQTETDYFYADYSTEAEKIAEAESVSNHVQRLLNQKFGEEQGGIRYQIYRDKVDETFQNQNDWAEARGVSVVVLKKHIDQIEKVISQNSEDFGY
jgi:hypothetical protein